MNQKKIRERAAMQNARSNKILLDNKQRLTEAQQVKAAAVEAKMTCIERL